jgi:glutathione peroxidase
MNDEDHAMTLHELSAKTLSGTTQDLGDFRGRVLLVVNTASACGFTPQYTGLEALWQEYKDKGLTVVGFPSNDFGGQEPGTEAEIQTFCSTRYDVTFPLFAKVKTKGDGQSPVYQFLTAAHGDPKWNFHKYLVGKDGQVKAAFSSKVAPDDPALRAAIDEALRAG